MFRRCHVRLWLKADIPRAAHNVCFTPNCGHWRGDSRSENQGTLPGDRVLDPCCGSGTIFRAAALTKTIATGIERDEDAQGMSLIAIREIEDALTN